MDNTKIVMPLNQFKAIISVALADKIKNIDFNSIDIKLTKKPDLAIITFKQETLPND